jgi:hypothetical protein
MARWRLRCRAMRRSLAVLFVALSVVAGACGGGGGSGANSAYCKRLKEVADEALKTTTTSAANMAALQAAFNKAIDKIAKEAPKEIDDDYDVLREYVDLTFKSQPTPTPAQQKRLGELRAEYTTASKNISDYNKNVCKYTLPTTSTIAPAPATTATTVKK